MRKLIKNLRELKNRPEIERGFTLIEALLVIFLIGVLGSVVTPIVIKTTQVNAAFLNQPSCINQGKTAEHLCQILAIAAKVKGTNELAKIDNASIPAKYLGDRPTTLVWQVASVKGSVCIVGYDPADSTSTFTHDKPFVFDSVSGENATGVGCGRYNEAGNYIWANDPTIPKPAYVQPVNAPIKTFRAVQNQNEWMTGSIDSYVEGEKLSVFIKRDSGFTPDTIVFDASYVCSNGYTQTNRIHAVSTGTGTWKGHTVTYGAAGLDAPKCNPKSVSLTAITGSQWTLGNTYNFTY
jgi:prepilin-type N-terminal cleavage/methylation domain-containing protein